LYSQALFSYLNFGFEDFQLDGSKLVETILSTEFFNERTKQLSSLRDKLLKMRVGIAFIRFSGNLIKSL
jgi:hypothetical protein